MKFSVFKRLSAVALAVGMLATTVPAMAAVDNSVESKEPPKTATVSISKVSQFPDYTEGNPSYNLDGAEYTVYKDKGCTQTTGKKIVIKGGKGSVSGLPHGQYWVKETKKATGFDLDTTVHYVDLRTKTSASFTSTEPPLMDPVSVLIKKEGDFDHDTSLGQTLEGARFEFKFYAITPNATDDPDIHGHKPKWTWVFKTDKYGYSEFSEEYQVSGPKLPLNIFGDPSLPFGVMTIQEITAPNGFEVNPKVFVNNIKWDTGSGNILYQPPTISEPSVKIKLVKYQEDFENNIDDKIWIKDAEFKHTFPNGNSETVKTDENGELYFNGLTIGKHVIEEINAPEGYVVNPYKLEFTVNSDLSITGLEGQEGTDTDGSVIITNKPDKPDGLLAEITFADKPAPFDLNIHKINDKNSSLEGAEFTLYDDEACQNEVMKATSDASGNLEMLDLIVGKTYYLKETKSPAGYKIPVNTDGSEIIWKIKVTSYPMNGEFSFSVNDKEYNSSTGQFHISGTPDDRVVNMELINTVSGKLPKTGSSAMVIVIIVGVILMGSAIVISIKHKKK